MTPDTAAMVQAMAGLGLSRAAVAAMIEVFLPDALTLDDRRFLAGPLVVHESPWNSTRPSWLEDSVGAERVGIVLGLTPDLIVGPAEIAAVMYGASLDAPMGRDHADLYVWATIGADAKRKGIEPLACFELHHIEPVPDALVLKPNGRLHSTYSRLAHDIRRRVIAAQTQRERETRKSQKTQDKQANTGYNNEAENGADIVTTVQLECFDL